MRAIREYLAPNGKCPFFEWLDQQSGMARLKVQAHVARLEQGNFSNVRPVGGGVHEKRIDWGSGLRVYFANDGKDLIILLAGSDKADQQRAISQAMEYWNDYKARKQGRPYATD